MQGSLEEYKEIELQAIVHFTLNENTKTFKENIKSTTTACLSATVGEISKVFQDIIILMCLLSLLKLQYKC